MTIRTKLRYISSPYYKPTLNINDTVYLKVKVTEKTIHTKLSYTSPVYYNPTVNINDTIYIQTVGNGCGNSKHHINVANLQTIGNGNDNPTRQVNVNGDVLRTSTLFGVRVTEGIGSVDRK